MSRRSRGGLVQVADAAAAWEVSAREARERLARLGRGGWVRRVQRGTYYLPSLGEGPDPVAEDPWILADVLFRPCYVGGWTAAHEAGLTEQIFHETFIATATHIRARRRTALGAEFRLARVDRARVESVPLVWHGAHRLRVSGPERTIVDALVDPGWVGGVRHLAEMLATYRGLPGASEQKLTEILRKFGNGAAHKRAGYLVERAWPEAGLLGEEAMRGRTTGVIRLDPAVHSRGRMSRRWGLWLNVTVGSDGSRT